MASAEESDIVSFLGGFDNLGWPVAKTFLLRKYQLMRSTLTMKQKRMKLFDQSWNMILNLAYVDTYVITKVSNCN